MDINHKLVKGSLILKDYVNKYAYIGLAISISSILIASIIVSYQITGIVNLNGFIKAQSTNPAIWILDVSPFIFAYWGQLFWHGLVHKTESMVAVKTDQLLHKSGDLESRLKYESQHDHFTQLPNALLFNEQISQAINKIEKGHELAVIILKLNDFKAMHNNFGNFNAQSILMQFVKKLKEMLVSSFILQVTMGINIIARIESDEFSLLLPRLNKEINYHNLLDNIIKATTLNFIVDEINIKISTTAGASIYPLAGKEAIDLVNHARTAVFHARKKNKPFAIYSPNMEEDFTTNRMIINQLKNSIENQEIKIYYQPIVEMLTGKIIGAEASARLVHEKYGLISTEKYIPLIEESDLIRELTSFMLTHVVKQLAFWNRAGYKIGASVNLSLQDAVDKQLPDFIKKLLDENKVAPKYLTLEFNENACLSNQEKAFSVLNKINNLGVKIAIHNFCSGNFSSLYLVNFPIKEIRIEKNLILNLIGNENNSKIVDTIVKLAELLKLDVLADGVENQEIREQLTKYGCRYGQGGYFSNPVSSYEFMALLK